MGIPQDLAFRLFGYSFGAWFTVANSESVHSIKLRRWDPKPGFHPFVLVADYDGGPTATVRPRSASRERGIEHLAHPVDHSTTCRIDKEGWIVPVLWSLRSESIGSDSYSCQEPYNEIVEKLKMGADR
jgi:hypothetical protein